MQKNTNTAIQFSAKLFRDATLLDEFDSMMVINAGVASNGYIENYACVAINYKDSPATTSATTYKLQGRINNTASSAQAMVLGGQGTLNISAMEF